MIHACWERRAAWRWLLGLAACTPPGSGDPAETGSSSGASTSSTEPSLTGTGGVFTVTSITGSEESSAGTTVAETATTIAETTVATESTSTFGSSTSTGETDPCQGLIAGLTTALTKGARCELLLRVDDDGTLLDWDSACGEVPAGDTYSSKTAIEATSCCGDGKLIGPGTSPFIFHQLPMAPNPGGLAIISNHLGAVVFEATIGVDALGTISTPALWQDSGLLGVGAGCDGIFALPMTTYDLSQGGVVDPPPLGMAAQQLLASSIAATALPAALEQVVVDRALVLGYQEKFEGPGSSFLVLIEVSKP